MSDTLIVFGSATIMLTLSLYIAFFSGPATGARSMRL